MSAEIPVHAEVYCADVRCGVSALVIVNPITLQVTHLVVGEGLDQEHMVAVDDVVETTANTIRLRCTKAEFVRMRPFLRGEHVPGEVPILVYAPNEYMMLPYVLPGEGVMLQAHDHIPPGELAVHRGTQVSATDGHVGRVDELLVDAVNDQITHLVLREGYLWGQKDVTIPVSQIERIEGDTVYLKLDKRSVQALPGIPVHRRM